ncbi:MAG: addiction module toxin, HicA family [bacterium]|nr:addiction module toxin, HicA family [bacterium]
MSYSRRKVMKALQTRGFAIVRQGGRHTIIRSPDGAEIAIPRHRELSRGTARGIANDANIDWAEFKGEIS